MESESGYFCYIEGLGSPNIRHRTIEKATAEANRLAGLEPTRNVYVLTAVLKIEGSGVQKKLTVEVKKKRLLEIS